MPFTCLPSAGKPLRNRLEIAEEKPATLTYLPDPLKIGELALPPALSTTKLPRELPRCELFDHRRFSLHAYWQFPNPKSPPALTGREFYIKGYMPLSQRFTCARHSAISGRNKLVITVLALT